MARFDAELNNCYQVVNWMMSKLLKKISSQLFSHLM